MNQEPSFKNTARYGDAFKKYDADPYYFKEYLVNNARRPWGWTKSNDFSVLNKDKVISVMNRFFLLVEDGEPPHICTLRKAMRDCGYSWQIRKKWNFEIVDEHCELFS